VSVPLPMRSNSNAQDDADLLKSSMLVGQRSFQRSLQPS
jgi:hypothetical protein